MPKYLFKASYNAEGLKGLIKDTPSGRRAALRSALKSVGGKVDCMYYGFGVDDVIVVVDVPDNAAAIRISTAIGTTGMVNLRTTPLMTVEEMDEALSKKANYNPPGSAK